MKRHHWIAIAVAAVLVIIVALVNSGGNPKKIPGNNNQSARTSNIAPNAPKWTEAEIEKLCQFRWAGKEKRIDGCIANNKEKIGQKKTLAEVKELTAAEAKLGTKPTDKAATQKTAPAKTTKPTDKTTTEKN